MFGRCGYLSCDCALCYTRSFFWPSVVASMAGLPAITETESSDRLSESEADETENSGNATGGVSMVKRRDCRRNVRNIHVVTERSTINVFHGQPTQRKGLLMPFVCLVVEI